MHFYCLYAPLALRLFIDSARTNRDVSAHHLYRVDETSAVSALAGLEKLAGSSNNHPFILIARGIANIGLVGSATSRLSRAQGDTQRDCGPCANAIAPQGGRVPRVDREAFPLVMGLHGAAPHGL